MQDLILNHLRKKKTDLMIYLSNGVPLKGRITSFDNFTFIIENEGKQSLVYKHAVSTIILPKDIKIENSVPKLRRKLKKKAARSADPRSHANFF